MEADHEEARSEQVSDAVDTIMETLRSHGYKPTLLIEDVEVHGGGPVPGWNPAQEHNFDKSCQVTESRVTEPGPQVGLPLKCF